MKMTTKNCPIRSKEEVEQILKEVFGKHKYSVQQDIYHPDRVEMEINYYDFLPADQVQRMLEQRIPGLQLTLCRWYSESVVSDAMREMYDECIEVWTYDFDGRPVRLCINQMVDAWLSDKKVCDGLAVYTSRSIVGFADEEEDNE